MNVNVREEHKVKKCYKCQETKDIYSFSRNKHIKDGFSNRCKSCVREHALSVKMNTGNKCIECGVIINPGSKYCIGCINKNGRATANGMCGRKSHSWKGGRGIEVHGYIRINSGNGKRQLEHRSVLEQYINRKLLPMETVHHINENRQDNRLENLMIFRSPGRHQHYHKLKREGNENKQRTIC